jgi:hypothetical protein
MTTVWLPFDPAPLGPLRDGLRVIVSGTNAPPEGYDEVACLVVMNPAQTHTTCCPRCPNCGSCRRCWPASRVWPSACPRA